MTFHIQQHTEIFPPWGSWWRGFPQRALATRKRLSPSLGGDLELRLWEAEEVFDEGARVAEGEGLKS